MTLFKLNLSFPCVLSYQILVDHISSLANLFHTKKRDIGKYPFLIGKVYKDSLGWVDRYLPPQEDLEDGTIIDLTYHRKYNVICVVEEERVIYIHDNEIMSYVTFGDKTPFLSVSVNGTHIACTYKAYHAGFSGMFKKIVNSML